MKSSAYKKMGKYKSAIKDHDVVMVIIDGKLEVWKQMSSLCVIDLDAKNEDNRFLIRTY